MSIQTTASERDESRRKRRSNDTATRTSDADTSEAARETDATRDTAPTHRNASDRPTDAGSSTDGQPTSRAARLQQGQGNRAVARAAAAARDRRDGAESPEDTVGVADTQGDASRGNENATDAPSPEGSAGGRSSGSRRQSGSAVRSETQAIPGTSAADIESAAPREQRDTESQASETGATDEGNRNTTKRAQQERREPSDHAETNQDTPLANRQGSHATPTGPQLDGLGVRPKLTVGQPDDQYEREADAVAEAVTTGRAVPASSTGRAGGGDGAVPALQVDETEELGQTQSDGTDAKPSHGQGRPSIASSIRTPGAGRSLPEGVRRRIAPALGTDLDGVQVHTGTAAARAAGNLGARAFTHRNHIFLGDGESPTDLRLMAHEATHVVQQGAAPAGGQRASGSDQATAGTGPAAVGERVSSTGAPEVQRFIGEYSRETLNEYVSEIPGWEVFTELLQYNPITGAKVEPSPAGMIERFLGYLDGQFDALVEKLREYQLFEDAYQKVTKRLNESDLSAKYLKETFSNALDAISGVGALPGIGKSVINQLHEHFSDLVKKVTTLGRKLVGDFVDIVQDAALRALDGMLADTAAWELGKKVMRENPLTEETVEASNEEILEDALKLFGKEDHLERLREQEKFEETAAWLGEQLDRFEELVGKVKDVLDEVWETFTVSTLSELGKQLQTLKTKVTDTIGEIADFAEDIASEVLARVKDALLGRLNQFAKDNLPGYDLLITIAGYNPILQKGVARTAKRILRGFLGLIPGGYSIYEQLAGSEVVGKAGERIKAAADRLDISAESVVKLFKDVWDSLSIEDLKAPTEAFNRVVEKFRGPIDRLGAFLKVVLRELVTVGLELMNFPSDLLGSIVTNAMQAFEAIKNDPIGFFLNALSAVKLGFEQFFANAGSHIAQGLTDWLFRGLRDAGLQPPTDLSLGSVLDFVFEVLGLSVDLLWEKLGERIGEERVEQIRDAIDKLTGIWTFVQDVRRDGIGAIWEHVRSQITGLWKTLKSQVQDWVMTNVITAAMKKLGSLLDPSGITAVINSFDTFLKIVQSAKEYAKDILRIVNKYVSTIASVAQGQLEAGASKLEQALANAIPVAIGFLANQFGLGNIGEQIEAIVQKVRDVVDSAIDWLFDKAEQALQSVMSAIRGDEGEERPAEDGEVLEVEPFQVGDEAHQLRVRMVAGAPAFEMASGEWGPYGRKFELLVSHYQKRAERELEASGLKAFREELDRIRTELSEEEQQVARSDASEGKKRAESVGILQRIASKLRELGATIEHRAAEPPQFQIRYGSLDRYDRATKAEGTPLTAEAHQSGSGASVDLPGIKLLEHYDRGHLLAKSLGGADIRPNLAPLHSQVNQRVMGSFERTWSQWLGADDDIPRVIHYSSRAEYSGRSALDSTLVQEIGAAPGSAEELFQNVGQGNLDATDLHEHLGGPEQLPLDTVEENELLIRRELASAFFPHAFVVEVDVQQGTDPPSDTSGVFRNP